MAKRIYGFICDEALQKWRDSNGFDPALIVANLNQGAGVATQNVIEYFNKVAVVKDARSSRFNNLTGSSLPLFGDLAFIIDQMPPNDEGDIITGDESGAIPADVLNIDAITPTTKWNNVFNIIEDCMYYRGSGSSTVTDMLDAKFQQGSIYAGYIPRSIGMSSDNGVVTYMAGITARVSNNTILSSDSVRIPYWFEFGFNFEIEGYEEVIFKLWVGEQSFLEQYPHVTVTDVVLPCDHSKLASPSTLVTPGTTTENIVLDAILENSDFINRAYKNNFKYIDNNNNVVYTESSGVTIFSTRYFPSSYDKSAKFAVIYKGPTPTNDLCRKAIRNKLIRTDISEDIWKVVFPDLFTKAVFFIVPMWTNKFTNPNAPDTEIGSGITKWSSFFNFVKSVFPFYPESILAQKLELLLNDATNLIMAVVPDLSNEGNKTMKLMHPTYVPVDGTSAGFFDQATETASLNIEITRAIACAEAGEISELDIYKNLSYVDYNVGSVDEPIFLKFIYFSDTTADYYLFDKSQVDKLSNIGV